MLLDHHVILYCPTTFSSSKAASLANVGHKGPVLRCIGPERPRTQIPFILANLYSYTKIQEPAIFRVNIVPTT